MCALFWHQKLRRYHSLLITTFALNESVLEIIMIKMINLNRPYERQKQILLP